MMHWIAEHGWAFWLIVMLAMLGLEMISLSLWFAMLAGGALVATFLSLAGVEFWIQLLTFALVSLVLMFGLRPFALRQLRDRTTDQRSNVARLIGSRGLVVDYVTPQSGLVRIGGEDWTARTKLAQGIAPGEDVSVDRIHGATAYVSPITTHES